MSILTTRGFIKSDELGLTNSHAHLIGMPPPWLYKTPTFNNDPDYNLSDVDKASQELRIYKNSGGKSFVDATTRDYGRNGSILEKLANEHKDINFIIVTGFNRGIYLSEWYHEASTDDIADLFISEIKDGIEGTSIRAGVIKIGVDYHRILPIEAKCIKAAVQTHHITKSPICVHTTLGTQALEVLNLLEKAKVDPGRIIFYHVDRNLDPWYWEEVAEKGPYLTLDQIGKIKYSSENKRIEFLVSMIEKGYENQLLLGTDFAKRSDFVSYGGGPGLGYLFEKFLPLMKKILQAKGLLGLERKLVTINPAKALSF